MDENVFAVVRMLPILFLPLGGWLLWLGWSGKPMRVTYVAAGCVAAAGLICFGPFIGHAPVSHGARWDALGAYLYFGIVSLEVLTVWIVAMILVMVRRKRLVNTDPGRLVQ